MARATTGATSSSTTASSTTSASSQPSWQGAGTRFASRTDTEVVLHAYEEWGPACLDRFNGMFAFAVWDARERNSSLARDRFGIKPLYYADVGGAFAFGSEVKALLAAGYRAQVSPDGARRVLHLPEHLSPTRRCSRACGCCRPGTSFGREDERIAATDALLGPRVRARRVSVGERRVGRAASAAPSRRAVDAPARERRADRQLPLRRHGLQLDRARRKPRDPAPDDVHGRLRSGVGERTRARSSTSGRTRRLSSRLCRRSTTRW